MVIQNKMKLYKDPVHMTGMLSLKIKQENHYGEF